MATWAHTDITDHTKTTIQYSRNHYTISLDIGEYTEKEIWARVVGISEDVLVIFASHVENGKVIRSFYQQYQLPYRVDQNSLIILISTTGNVRIQLWKSNQIMPETPTVLKERLIFVNNMAEVLTIVTEAASKLYKGMTKPNSRDKSICEIIERIVDMSRILLSRVEELRNGEYQLDSKEPEQMVMTYIAIDNEIMRREILSAAPKFGQQVARQRQLRQILDVAEQSATSMNEELADVSKLFTDLRLNRSPTIAAEHEEFIANTNRALLNRNMINILKKRLFIEENKLEQASKDVLHLQNLYQQQDMLLKNIFGESYGSDKEKNLEQELDTMRNYRDTLASGVLQWKDCADDVMNASELAARGLDSIKNVGPEKNLKMATEARDAIQEAVFLIQISQETLTSVQFPYCTSREISAILQAVEYIFTDIMIEERYQHSIHVYKNFQQRTSALYKWILKTVNGSLQRDLSELDEKVVATVQLLRDERLGLICRKLKLDPKTIIVEPISNPAAMSPEPTSVYQKPMRPESRYIQQHRYGDVITPQKIEPVNLGPRDTIFTDPNLQREFESKMAARRSAMWPSRRIEELRELTTNNNNNN